MSVCVRKKGRTSKQPRPNTPIVNNRSIDAVRPLCQQSRRNIFARSRVHRTPVRTTSPPNQPPSTEPHTVAAMGKDQELMEAARSGNIAIVEKLLMQKSKRSGPLAR